MSLGVLATAFVFGLRHGIEWDHIAAISDLSGATESRRRGFFLSFLYAAGHAAIVLVLGALAIAFGTAVPDSVNDAMTYVVGISFVVLGTWVIASLIRQGRDFRLQSRWMVVLNGTFAGLRRVRQGRSGRVIDIRHDHEHEHEGEHDTIAATEGADPAHDHAHVLADTDTDTEIETEIETGLENEIEVSELVGASRRQRSWRTTGERTQRMRHRHAHQHTMLLPDEPGAGYGNGTAAGIGVLHGVGVESPTQIAVFVASSAVGGVTFGLVILVAWVVGLVVANSFLALLAGFGLLHAERHFAIYATVALLVGFGSIVVGVALLAGQQLIPDVNL